MTEYRPLIEQIAADLDLDPNLVEAVVITESSAHTDAFRFEPAFFDRYLKGKPEYAGQIPRRIASSYGLAQVMFSTAQQYGFVGHPELLFVPDVGLRYGCLHLRAMLTWAGGDVHRALAAYNGGQGQGSWKAEAPQRYATRVMKLLDSVKQAHTGIER
jgi:soluble lytic murein transglycosylase-like protein